MKKLLRTSMLVLVFALFAQPLGLLAQEDNMDAPVIGDGDSLALDIVQDYLLARDVSLLGDGVVLYDRTYLEPITGSENVANAENIFYGQTFTDIMIDPIRYIVTDEAVVAEYNFTGTNTGTYIGYAATGTTVNVPMVDIFTIEDSLITSVRRYYDSADLQGQLGYTYYTPGAYPYAVNTTPLEEGILEVDDLVETPTLYLDQTVTVEGKVGSLVESNAFYFWDEDLIDLNQERVLVVSPTADGFDNFYPVEDSTARVTGTVTDFTIADVSGELDYDLNDELYEEYETVVVLIADTVTNREPVQTIPQVEDYPMAFYGKTVTLEGTIGSQIDDHSFVFFDDQLVGIAGSIIGVDTDPVPIESDTYDDQRIRVTGVIHANNVDIVSSEYGVELDEQAWADYTERPVIAITDIELIE